MQLNDGRKSADQRYYANHRERIEARRVERGTAKAWRESPRGRYSKQKEHATARGVEFKLTFDEWWAIWEPHYEQRGIKGYELCMCRTGDDGAYEVGNVRIDTNVNNIRERYVGA